VAPLQWKPWGRTERGRKERIGEETRVQSGFRVERNCEVRRGRGERIENRTVTGLPRFKDRGKTEILQVVLGFWEV
jgi:hypothetical protein